MLQRRDDDSTRRRQKIVVTCFRRARVIANNNMEEKNYTALRCLQMCNVRVHLIIAHTASPAHMKRVAEFSVLVLMRAPLLHYAKASSDLLRSYHCFVTRRRQ